MREFYSTAAEYALKNLPLHDTVLENSQFVRLQSRESASISQILYLSQGQQLIQNHYSYVHNNINVMSANTDF